MTLESSALELEELVINVTQDGDSNHIVWTGTSEIQDPGIVLGPFLRGLVPKLAKRKAIIDFRKLEYMNSATLQPILQLIKELSANQIETVMLYDPEVEWQRLSFRSIKAIAMTLPNISIATG